MKRKATNTLAMTKKVIETPSVAGWRLVILTTRVSLLAGQAQSNHSLVLTTIPKEAASNASSLSLQVWEVEHRGPLRSAFPAESGVKRASSSGVGSGPREERDRERCKGKGKSQEVSISHQIRKMTEQDLHFGGKRESVEVKW